MCITILKIVDAFFGSPRTEPANGAFPLIQDSTPEVAFLWSRYNFDWHPADIETWRPDLADGALLTLFND